MDTIQYERLEGYLRAAPHRRLKNPAWEPESCQFKRQATYHITKGKVLWLLFRWCCHNQPTIDWGQKGNNISCILAG